MYETQPFSYVQLNGKATDDMRVTVTFLRLYNNIGHTLKHSHVTSLTEQTRAFNALVSHAVRADGPTRLTRVRANRFYANSGYEETNGSADDFLALRGYYTSVRKTEVGPLLNLNTATSVLLPVVTADKFLGAKGLDVAEK